MYLQYILQSTPKTEIRETITRAADTYKCERIGDTLPPSPSCRSRWLRDHQTTDREKQDQAEQIQASGGDRPGEGRRRVVRGGDR
jgi:hypothetical protein